MGGRERGRVSGIEDDTSGYIMLCSPLHRTKPPSLPLSLPLSLPHLLLVPSFPPQPTQLYERHGKVSCRLLHRLEQLPNHLVLPPSLLPSLLLQAQLSMHEARVDTGILEVVQGGQAREGEFEGEEEGERLRKLLQVPLADFYGREGGREGGRVEKKKCWLECFFG